jgi:hypothetical protein
MACVAVGVSIPLGWRLAGPVQRRVNRKR